MSKRFFNSQGAVRSGESVTFSFGENWRKYLRHLDQHKADQARRSLASSFDRFELTGETFLDIGCGSGLFSLAATELGSRSVTSVDVDPASVSCATYLRSRVQGAASWNIVQGSVLDSELVEELPRSSRVYAWGVLHHTGAMWTALENALSLVEPGGVLCVALYVEPNRPDLALRLKRYYNRSGAIRQAGLKAAYAAAVLLLGQLRHRFNPVRYVRQYGVKSRGMSFWRDVEDWLGGLPCEWADPAEVQRFAEARGFETVRVIPGSPGSNAEYLFRNAP